MLEFIWENVTSGVESVRDARAFVSRIGTLSRAEREFMDLALRDGKHLDRIRSAFPPEERGEAAPRPPVAAMGPCGLARPSKDERRLSAG